MRQRALRKRSTTCDTAQASTQLGPHIATVATTAPGTRDKMSQQSDKHDVRSRRRLRNGEQFAELAIRERLGDLDGLTVHFWHSRATAADGEKRQNGELQKQRGERGGITSHRRVARQNRCSPARSPAAPGED